MIGVFTFDIGSETTLFSFAATTTCFSYPLLR